MDNTKGMGLDQSKEGAGNLTSSADYFKSLMSGDPAKMSAVLAPQISILKGQNAQRLATASQFSNRSGGTNARMQQDTEDTQRSIQQLFDMLGPEAAREVATIGGVQEGLGNNLLGISTSASSSLAGQAGGARNADNASAMDTAKSAGQAVAALLGIR